MKLSVSDIIQIIGIIASLITSIVAIIISILTVRQNSEMIEESTRAYISIYEATTNFSSLKYYFVIKNFGQTGGYIKSFSCNYDLSKLSYDKGFQPFEHINGTYFAPNQTKIFNINHSNLVDDGVETISFHIEYVCQSKTYIENVTLNFAANLDTPVMRASTPDQELKIISYALQDIAEKQL